MKPRKHMKHMLAVSVAAGMVAPAAAMAQRSAGPAPLVVQEQGSFAAGGTVLWWMLQDVLAGRLGPGTVAAAIVVVSELPQQATELLGVSFQAARSTRIGRRALWLER